YTAENPYSVSAADKQIIGQNSPDWSLGFQNTFTYKNFDLSVYMYARFGQMMYYDPLLWYSSGGGNFPDYFNYWTPENPSNDFPSLNSSRNWKDDSYYTARAFVDGSFFKIKNITLGYTLPQKACRKVGLSRFRVYATVTNPLVVAKSHLVKEYDPEMNGSLDFPLTKQVVFGVNLSF
ncbi:MAG: SusC/RagA family protein, partial [Alistipes sp.]|nr:SusC/RagA family protein [Alistipes sp.]